MKTKTAAAAAAAAMTTISGRSFKYAAVEAERHHMPQNGQTDGGTDGGTDTKRTASKNHGMLPFRGKSAERERGGTGPGEAN